MVSNLVCTHIRRQSAFFLKKGPKVHIHALIFDVRPRFKQWAKGAVFQASVKSRAFGSFIVIFRCPFPPPSLPFFKKKGLVHLYPAKMLIVPVLYFCIKPALYCWRTFERNHYQDQRFLFTNFDSTISTLTLIPIYLFYEYFHC